VKTIRGLPLIESGCLDSSRNVFYSKFGEILFTMRQPRKSDDRNQRVAWKKVGEASRRRYIRLYVDQDIYDMKKRCRMPLYRGEVPGILPLTVEMDGETVGFCDIFFKYGKDFAKFEVPPEDKCATGSITALDKYMGMGVGTGYSSTSNAIAKHFGCQWILGTTFMKGGMRSIRAKDDWKVVRRRGELVDHKKKL